MGGRRSLCRHRRIQADHRATVQKGISRMNRMEVMHGRLAVFDPVSLDISDESHKHAGHRGALGGRGRAVLPILTYWSVCSGYCALAPPTRKPLATISVAMYSRHTLII